LAAANTAHNPINTNCKLWSTFSTDIINNGGWKWRLKMEVE
jgi:hypothetical protein